MHLSSASPPPPPSGGHRRLGTLAWLAVLIAMALFALLAPQLAHGQAINPGASAIYFPRSRRALLFGGATRPTYFRTITAIDLSKPFATNSPPLTTLQGAELPEGTQYLIPWVSASGSEAALFGGIVPNTTSTQANAVVPANAIYEVALKGDGAAVENINKREFTYNVQAPCYTLATSVADDGKTYMFGGFSYVTNTETSELRVFDDSKSLKNVTVLGSSRPPRRQLGSLARLDARRLLLSGGFANNTGLQDVWIFDSQTSSWSPTTGLGSVRFNHQTVVVKPAGSAKSYVVQIGGDSARSLFEYAELPETGGVTWKTSSSVEGKADLRYLVNQAPVVIGGDQLVMFGVSLDPQQFDRFASVVVIKVKEQSPGSLAFQWMDNFTPAEQTNPSTSGDASSGGTGGSGGSSMTMTLVGILVGVAVIGVAFAGFVWFRRSRNSNNQAAHKPLNASSTPPGPSSTVPQQQQQQQQQQPANMFAPAPNVQQQFQHPPQPVQQQPQAPPLQQQYQQPMVPVDPHRMSSMSSSLAQPQMQAQAYGDPRLSYMSAMHQPVTYTPSPPPSAPGTSYMSNAGSSTGPAPYPATQMPLAVPYPGMSQASTTGYAGGPAKSDVSDKKASWYGGGPQVIPQQQPFVPMPSAPPAPTAGGGIMTSMPMPPQPPPQGDTAVEDEVLYLGSHPTPSQPQSSRP